MSKELFDFTVGFERLTIKDELVYKKDTKRIVDNLIQDFKTTLTVRVEGMGQIEKTTYLLELRRYINSLVDGTYGVKSNLKYDGCLYSVVNDAYCGVCTNNFLIFVREVVKSIDCVLKAEK